MGFNEYVQFKYVSGYHIHIIHPYQPEKRQRVDLHIHSGDVLELKCSMSCQNDQFSL